MLIQGTVAHQTTHTVVLARDRNYLEPLQLEILVSRTLH